MIPREQWGAKHGAGRAREGAAVGVVIHHSYSPDIPAGLSVKQVAEMIRGIEDHHAKKLTPKDPRIGYNWLIDQDGRIWEGLGWGRIGAHAPGANSTHEGVCVLINGEKREPSEKAWGAGQSLIRAGVATGNLDLHYTVRSHDEFKNTSCPGDKVRSGLHRLRGLAPEVGAPPKPHAPVWSDYRKEWLIPTRVESDESWWFVPASALERLPSIRAGAPLSQMRKEP